MLEKRKYKRFLIEGMDVQCKILFVTEVKLINMGFGGAAVSLGKRLNMGERYTLRMESEDNAISLKGVVVWERITPYTQEIHGMEFPIYEAGISFDDVLTAKGNDFVTFMRENISDEAIKTRLEGLRVNIIHPEGSFILDDRENCQVKIISLGGMLLETKEKLGLEGRFPMEITFPEDTRPVQVLGRTAYCAEIPDKMPRRYDTGIEFIEIKTTDSKRLKEFIDILKAI